MSVVKWHPVNEVLGFDLLQRNNDVNGSARARTAGPQLAIDAYETEGELVLTASLPGASREDLEIEFEDRLLTMRGTVKAPQLPEGAKSLLSERAYGSTARTLRIPHHLDVSNSKATFVDGVLEVRLPKSAEARKKTITIE